MLTREERQNVEIEITNFQMYLKDIGKEVPNNKLVYDHTVIFFRKVLGYHVAPIYINPSPNRNASLLIEWQAYILNELEAFDEDSFKRISENYHDVDKMPLEGLKSYIREITGSIEK
ncbi:MAG: hypothetical protein ACK5M1_06580 [Xanthomarina gelatinilytica]|uniref:hypothetical protein n=1 Tax=Xanthomarina gelatinilytica TaxID=1137281 RepID=UPI003A87CFA2